MLNTERLLNGAIIVAAGCALLATAAHFGLIASPQGTRTVVEDQIANWRPYAAE